MYQERTRLSANRLAAFNNLIKQERRILVIGDIHASFELEVILSSIKKPIPRTTAIKLLLSEI